MYRGLHPHKGGLKPTKGGLKNPHVVLSICTMNPTKNITIQVSASYELPELYTKASEDTESIEEALTMGSWIQATLKSKKSTEEVRKVTERKDAELLRIQTQYQERMAKLMDDMKVSRRPVGPNGNPVRKKQKKRFANSVASMRFSPPVTISLT